MIGELIEVERKKENYSTKKKLVTDSLGKKKRLKGKYFVSLGNKAHNYFHRFEQLTENKKFHMMVQCVTYYGQTLMVNKYHFEIYIGIKTKHYFLNFQIEIEGWGYSPRGAGYLFGGDVVQRVKFIVQARNYSI